MGATSAAEAVVLSFLVTLPMNMRVMSSGRWISVYLKRARDEELFSEGICWTRDCSVLVVAIPEFKFKTLRDKMDCRVRLGTLHTSF